MCPEFMSGALRSHKQTKFSRGAYITAPPKPPAAIMARCARQKVRIRELRTPRNEISLRPWVGHVLYLP